METNKLCEVLEERAMTDARKHLRSVVDKFNKDIGLAGTTEYIIIKGDKKYSDREMGTYISTMLNAIVDQLIAKREKGIRAKAVSDFMKQFESFQNHMLTIEQYAQDMLD